MSTTYSAGSPQNDPMFNNAMQKFQHGEWQAGLDDLKKLIDKYPYASDLQSLFTEMQIRSHIDKDERQDNLRASARRMRKWVFIAITLAVLVIGFYVGLQTYSGWVQSQWQTARSAFEEEALSVQLAIRFRDAQNLLQAGRPELAMQVFEEIAAENPEYPGLQTYLDEANRLQGLESRYQEAQRLYDLNDLSGALAVYEEIDGEDPFYKDVAIRIESIQNQFFMGDMLSQAEKAFEAQDWQQAASGFETVRAINQQFQPEHIESRLYDSYINAAMAAINADTTSFENLQLADSYFRKALTLRPQDASTQQERDRVREIFKDSLSQKYVQAAQAAIGDQEDSLQALETAEEYFRQALALRPDDPDILLQRDLARSYLQAQADYSNALWDKVIVSLEQVYAQDPQYAKGTSLQTLYEAYMARGENFLSFSNYEEALSDFTRAISLAEQSATPKLRLFSAQIRAAEAKGALGDYEDAVFQYQDALVALDLDQTDIELSSTTTRDLDRAENYVRLRYYKHAYNYFRKSTPEILAQFSTIAHVVESGEYLTMLANRYNTTVEAIVKANNLNTSKQIQAGQEIIVPGYTGTE